jgi:methionine aminopeptidase
MNHPTAGIVKTLHVAENLDSLTVVVGQDGSCTKRQSEGDFCRSTKQCLSRSYEIRHPGITLAENSIIAGVKEPQRKVEVIRQTPG